MTGRDTFLLPHTQLRTWRTAFDTMEWPCNSNASIHKNTFLGKGHLMMSQIPANPVLGDLGGEKAARVSSSGTRICIFSMALQPYPGTHLFFSISLLCSV